MRFVNFFLLSLVVAISSSCVEMLDVDVPPNSETIVIDALVTDLDTVQHVYICRGGDFFHPVYENVTLPSIDDVSVSLADDRGNTWCFVDIEDVKSSDVYYGSCDGVRGRHFVLVGTHLTAGQSYHIKVNVGQRSFSASDFMHPSPESSFIKFVGHKTYDDYLWSPVLHLQDSRPDTADFYMFTNDFFDIREYSSSGSLYIQRLSDEGLRGDMDGVRISLGIGAESQEKFSGIYFEEKYKYELYTIGRSTYDFIGVVEQHLTGNGGIYAPTPSTPFTNFSGDNVCGIFVAASKKEFKGTFTIRDVED